MRILLCALLLLSACSKRSEGKDQLSAAEDKDQPPEPASFDARPSSPKSESQPDELGYGDDVRLFDTPAQAVEEILKSKPRIIGFGEYHKLANSAPVQSALYRFANEIFDVLAPQSAHLILETWSIDPSCGAKAKAVTEVVEKTIQRPAETENEMQILLRKSQEFGVAGHVLPFACDEYKALLSAKGLDTEKLLEVVSAKLGQEGKAAFAISPAPSMVLLYGGATHNNLTPYQGLEAWSYAQDLAAVTKSSFIEVDLYVPEFVEGDPILSQEAWYPLLKEARTNQVVLIRRSPSSFILLMRKALAMPAAQGATPGTEALKAAPEIPAQ